MSAFMVSDKTMNAVLQSFPGGAKAETKLGQELYAMNSRALGARYGDPVEGPEEFEINNDFPPATPEDQLTALRCLLYQCAEGNVPDEPLYKMLEAHADRLERKIGKRQHDLAYWD